MEKQALGQFAKAVAWDLIPGQSPNTSALLLCLLRMNT